MSDSIMSLKEADPIALEVLIEFLEEKISEPIAEIEDLLDEKKRMELAVQIGKNNIINMLRSALNQIDEETQDE